MMRSLIILLSFFPLCLLAQKVTVNPTITPASFKSTDLITVTYDVTGTPLANLSSAYIWVWIPGKNIDAKYNINPASSSPTLSENAKFTKSVESGTTKFTISFVPQDFFTQPICLETQLGMLIKGNDWSNGQSTDASPIPAMTPLSTCFVVELNSPTENPLFVDVGSNFLVEAQSSETATFTLSVDGMQVDQQMSITEYSFTYTFPQSSGIYPVSLLVANAENDTTITFQYLIDTPSEELPRAPGIRPGINYDESDPTTVTLCLLAPLKDAAYVIGDFNDFEVSIDAKMYRDGEYFWIQLEGLTAGQEYGYQYLVDELFIADPYADKILDPEDVLISDTTYPDLKAYPQAALRSHWYLNRVSVFQTGQTPYDWQTIGYVRPPKEELVIYEILLRDFFDSENRNYQTLIDTIGYLKRLGINAIELMPVMEFNGNESWGYNPAFMFAPDKYYGTKNKLKELVDVCHANGIAVILDIALNHQDIPNPYAMMYFDFGLWRPTAENPFFNETAKHPFNVFNDMDHESAYTQAYVDTINHYWLNEFKVDGFRFDLSKGFTQVNYGTSDAAVGPWSAYDASRIAILKRMADKIWSHSPDTYIILEHFGANSEEKELAEYRVGEGKGMMLWGNLNYAFNENTMGYESTSSISGISYKSRGWTAPHLITYMESHDEERLMWKNLEYGNSISGYDVKQLSTALLRMKAAFALFLAVPGPKMMWEFGELGYDYGINRCTDGSINPPGDEGGPEDCRLDNKPPAWDFRESLNRESLYNFVSDFMRLRKSYDVFNTSDFTYSGNSTLAKSLTLKNEPYTSSPVSADEMNAQLVTNFGLSERTVAVSFPHAGTWYDYYNETELNVTSTPFNITLRPGGYALYTDFQIENKLLVTDVKLDMEKTGEITVYPNPVIDFIRIESSTDISHAEFHSIQGVKVYPQSSGSNQWDVRQLPSGLYIINLVTSSMKRQQIKFVKY